MIESQHFELSLSASFDAAHKLLDPRYGSGTRLHGHTYHVVVAMRGASLRDDGMLFDDYAVEETIRKTVGTLHDTYLNDVPELQQVNTTPEVIARYLWERLAPQMAGLGVRTMAVEIFEAPTTRVRYEAVIEAS